MSDYIPGEIQVEILKLLPVSSLLRFRSVCKWWKQLIDSHSFIRHHLALQNPRFIFDSEDSRFLPSFDNLTWPINPDPIVYHIIGALHGVVCLYYGNRILIWNPSIRKLSILPEPCDDWEKSEYASLARVFEINYSAFWMDPCTKQYKIIIFKLLYDDEFIEFGEMYSSIGQTWKLCPLGEVRFYEPLIHNPCIVIGAVAYWLSHDFKFREHGLDVILLCFDFEKEIFDTIEAPSYNFDDRKYFHPVLCNLKGSLSVVYLNPIHRCEIYSRQQGSWVNLFGFTVPCHLSRIRVVVDVEEKQQDCRFIALTDNEQLVLCDTSADLCTPLKRGMVNPRYIDFACYFVESLLLP